MTFKGSMDIFLLELWPLPLDFKTFNELRFWPHVRFHILISSLCRLTESQLATIVDQ